MSVICNIRALSASEQIVNLLPGWEKTRMLETQKSFYFEVPLKGKGIYDNALSRSDGKAYSYPMRSFLILVKNKEDQEINYYVVTTILTRVGHKKSPDEEFYYVGNCDLEGLLLFSRLDGSLLKTIHLRNGISRLIYLGNPPGDAPHDDSCTLSLRSSTSGYQFKETCDLTCEGCCSNCKAYCGICRESYCFNRGGCKNNCGTDVIASKWKTCLVCNTEYDVTIQTSCPNGCNTQPCVFCHKYPCACLKPCENCGSMACNGPWYCSQGGGEINNPAPTAPKAQKIFRNSNMTKENWEILERMLDKIMRDCMGEGLYNSLTNVLNGKTLTIQFSTGSNGAFTADGSTAGITIGKEMESNQLFHEMMHAFQAYRTTLTGFNGMALNLEIEAHYTQYLYLKKLKEYPGSKWEEQYKESKRHEASARLEDYVDSRGGLIQSAAHLGNYLSTTVQNAFRSTNTYKDYAYNGIINSINNFSRLNEITKNCY